MHYVNNMKVKFGDQNKMKKKIIAMIPARIGSKRIIKKNLRLIDGKPLISYNIETAVKSKVFDEVYVNSESDIFSNIAHSHGAQFYQRPADLSTDETNNDDFLIDFINNNEGDVLIQILPTSPLLKVEEIKDFVFKMLDGNFDTYVSTVNHKIAGLFKNELINSSRREPHISSQDMQPIQTYATVLMGWKYKNFKENYNKYGFAYHGGDGKVGYHPISGLTTIDVDNEEDFRMAEVAINLRRKSKFKEPKFYGELEDSVEKNVPEILKKDGVNSYNFKKENKPLVTIDRIINDNGTKSSWCHRLVNTEYNSATLIGQLPGEGNRLHYHPDWSEWWYIMKGKWEWEIEGKSHVVEKGDFVFIEKGKKHKITALGDEMAIRLAVSREDVAHVYPK